MGGRFPLKKLCRFQQIEVLMETSDKSGGGQERINSFGHQNHPKQLQEAVEFCKTLKLIVKKYDCC